MTLALAIAVLLIGGVLFAIGVGGQINLGKRRAKAAHPGDRAGRRIVLTLAAIVIGCWMIIASAVAILHHNSHQSPSNPGGGSPAGSSPAVH